MPTTLTPDICVIGGGSGGLSVAAAAAAFGVAVVLIEKGRMGGDCLNYGCVPSKALIAAGKHAQAMRHGGRFGIADVEPEIDFRQVNRHVHSVIEAISPNDSVERFTAMGVRVIQAEARFIDARTVAAGEYAVRARRFVIATGSAPQVPPIPGLDAVRYLTNETLFELTARPAHLVVIGGGPIGMEMAQAHRRLGSEVTVIEAGSVLANEDREAAAVVLAKLRSEGVVVLESTKVTGVDKRGRSGVRVTVEAEDGVRAIDGSHLLIATGRKVVVDGLGLDAAGIGHGPAGITVDDRLRTSNPRVFAIGDAAGGLKFTHVANYHAGLVLRSILFRLRARENRRIIPRATFTDPELAHVGLDEEAARKAHKRLSVLRWPYAENDRAQAERRTGGFVKVFADGRGRILGVTIVGSQAGEMIGLWSLAMTKDLRLRDIAGSIWPYPTMGEIGKRAAISYLAPATRKPLVRWLVRFLRRFG